MLDVKMPDPPKTEGAGDAVVQYAEAVMSGQAGLGITEDIKDLRAHQARNNPRSKVRMAFDSGQTALAMGKHMEAVRHFSEAIQLDPEYAEAHYRLGLAYVQAGDMLAARRERAKLQTLDPDRAKLLKHLITD